jgi:hypothetical protein
MNDAPDKIIPPTCILLDDNQLAAAIGVHRNTLTDLRKKPGFPKSIELPLARGRRTVAADLEAYIAGLRSDAAGELEGVR